MVIVSTCPDTVSPVSLRRRLLFAASFILAAFLTISAVSLNNAFQNSLQQAQKQRLKNYIYNLLTAADFQESGKIVMPDKLAEPKFSQPNSGLYAKITQGQDIIWQSTSLLGQRIPITDVVSGKHDTYSLISSQTGDELLNLSYPIIWENDQGEQFHYTFHVTEGMTFIQQQQAEFQRSLWYWLGGTGLALMLVQLLLLRWTIQPLSLAARELHAIEQGQQSHINGRYPKELNELTANLNALLTHEKERQQRYKYALSDLAHSLKTPIAVFRGLIENNSDLALLKKESKQQLNELTYLIDYQLQRAATEGRSSLQAAIDLEQVSLKICNSLDKVYAAKHINKILTIETGVKIHFDQGDLYELLGNVLENAYKYCQQQVKMTVTHQENMLIIAIEDDGPGIAVSAQQAILQRGQRLTKEHEGQGLGLAIVGDIVAAYRGHISIEKSHLGGAKFIITLSQRAA